MKVVDIADEIFRELGDQSNFSIPTIAFWTRTNLGALNNYIHTSFSINLSTLEVLDENSNEISINEVAILKKMFMIHFYDFKLRENIGAASVDSVISVSDDGSSVTKINKNEVSKTFSSIKRDELAELKSMISSYKMGGASPQQVAGDDTIEGFFGSNRDFNRINDV